MFEPILPGVSDTTGVPFEATDLQHFVPDADAGDTVTDPTRPDTDGDGLDDNEEDLDGDGAWAGNVDGIAFDETDPTLRDSDQDGLDDLEEGGTGPDAWDADGDEIIDPLDPDGTSWLEGGGGCGCGGGGASPSLWLFAFLGLVVARKGKDRTLMRGV